MTLQSTLFLKSTSKLLELFVNICGITLVVFKISNKPLRAFQFSLMVGLWRLPNSSVCRQQKIQWEPYKTSLIFSFLNLAIMFTIRGLARRLLIQEDIFPPWRWDPSIIFARGRLKLVVLIVVKIFVARLPRHRWIKQNHHGNTPVCIRFALS